MSPASIPAYSVAGRGEFLVSAANFSRLRDVREAAVAELKVLLGETKFDSTGSRLGDSPPLKFSQDQLVMLIDLNAVETLPELLRIEAGFHQLLQEKDGPNGLPEISYEGGVGYFSKKDATVAEQEKMRREANLEKAHRDVLGVVTAILRQEQYQPMIESEMEGRYRQALEAGRPSEGGDGKLTPNQKQFVAIDPLYGIPVWRGAATMPVPYDAALREQIVSWAHSFLETVPAAQRKGAAGMTEWPVAR